MDSLLYLTSQYFDPRPEMPAPRAGIFCKPRCWIAINVEWLPHIAGVLDRLTYLDAWQGDEEEVTRAISEIECLIAELRWG